MSIMKNKSVTVVSHDRESAEISRFEEKLIEKIRIISL
jgi:hypothetical protein